MARPPKLPASFLVFLYLLLLLSMAAAQRGRTYLEESEYGRPRPVPIGSDFPYKGGERAIFHFDEGDEKFIDTIRPLINGLNEMSVQINRQGMEVTRAFADTLKECRDCKVSQWAHLMQN